MYRIAIFYIGKDQPKSINPIQPDEFYYATKSKAKNAFKILCAKALSHYTSLSHIDVGEAILFYDKKEKLITSTVIKTNSTRP